MTNSNSLLHLEGLTESERRDALQILSELSQNNNKTYNDLKYADYNEIPVDIETFLTDDKYLGNAWKDTHGKLSFMISGLIDLKSYFLIILILFITHYSSLVHVVLVKLNR